MRVIIASLTLVPFFDQVCSEISPLAQALAIKNRLSAHAGPELPGQVLQTALLRLLIQSTVDQKHSPAVGLRPAPYCHSTYTVLPLSPNKATKNASKDNPAQQRRMGEPRESAVSN